MLKFAAPWSAHALHFIPTGSGLVESERAACLHLYGGVPPYLTSTNPIANNDSANAVAEVPEVVNVVANDAAAPPAEIPASAITITVQPPNGLAVANANNTVTYTSDPGVSGLDTFTYRLTDSEGLTDEADVVMTVVLERLADSQGFVHGNVGRIGKH